MRRPPLPFFLSPTIVPRISSVVDSHVCRFVSGHCFEKEELVEIMLDLEEKTQVRAQTKSRLTLPIELS